ncbi:bacterial hemoglobin [Aspergillus heteromorphus CBS 117.55]|uniref:nitric oxide dioxygenase n=1 Tax=Aspergillus heteromorphus CBS 117.55 TaxID=1448321 RepID=A0A317W225_9EURO|nr:bacterial hemoglobin [Aspergillus heteromorphus CBS 117.55]PWY80523.1 bacterial hemoglobin [Aspergillus heteromorphus CBS 117.55]
MALTQEQTDIIKATVPVIKEHGNAVTAIFYKNLLTAHPELNAIFNTPNQVNGHQPRALAGAVFAYAANIDNLAALGGAVELICHKHASLYVQPEHYPIVGKFLLGAMGEVLGDAFTPAIQDAWAAAYGQLADIMIGREAALYQAAEGWTDFREFRIARKIPESSEITSFYLEPVDGKALPLFLPGQYISVQILVPELGHPQVRQYSLSDKPSSQFYRISVKREAGLSGEGDAKAHPGYVSNLLHDTKQVGDTVKVSHPFGDFFLSDAERQSSSPIVLLAAGVGLTPLTSILNTLLETPAAQTQRQISFVHGARTSAARAFRPQIRELASNLPNLHATFFTSHPAPEDKQGEDYDFAGRLDLSKLDPKSDLFLDDASAQYYVCGPTPFMLDVKAKLTAEGVSADRIKMELFGTGGVPV